MLAQNERPLRHHEQYRAESACVYCERFNCHESWCPTQNANVQYAYRAVLQPDLLNLGDQIILHALGVAWGADIVWPNGSRRLIVVIDAAAANGVRLQHEGPVSKSHKLYQPQKSGDKT